MLLSLGLMLALSACSGGAGGEAAIKGTSTVSPGSSPAGQFTPMPTIPAIPTPTVHTLTIGTFLADAVFPGQDGLLLHGSPGPTYHGPGPAGTDGVYFFGFGSQQVKTIATPTAAPDGTQRGVQASMIAGDWIAYEVADANNAHWSIRAVNTKTSEDRLIDSYAQEGSAPTAPQYGTLVTDGVELVWSAGIQTTGAPAFVLKSYNFASQQTRVLLSGPQTPIVAPRAVANGSVLLVERHDSPAPSDGVYLWRLTDPAPRHISTDDPVNAALNDHFAVWDNPQHRSLALYNRDTGQLTENWERNCIRPAIAQDRPYVVCLSFDAGYLWLVRVPSGQTLSLGAASTGETGAIANGRDYWVQPGTSAPDNNVVNYIDLPAS